MSTKTSYTDQVAQLAEHIRRKAAQIQNMEKARLKWASPGAERIHIGENLEVVLVDGSVNPGLEGVHREVLAYIDNQLHKLRGELEGLRFRLVNLGKTGGAA